MSGLIKWLCALCLMAAMSSGLPLTGDETTGSETEMVAEVAPLSPRSVMEDDENKVLRELTRHSMGGRERERERERERLEKRMRERERERQQQRERERERKQHLREIRKHKVHPEAISLQTNALPARHRERGREREGEREKFDVRGHKQRERERERERKQHLREIKKHRVHPEVISLQTNALPARHRERGREREGERERFDVRGHKQRERRRQRQRERERQRKFHGRIQKELEKEMEGEREREMKGKHGVIGERRRFRGREWGRGEGKKS